MRCTLLPRFCAKRDTPMLSSRKFQSNLQRRHGFVVIVKGIRAHCSHAVTRHCMRWGSRRTLKGLSWVREPLLKVYDEHKAQFCQAMSSRIPLYLLDANDPYSTTALASSRYIWHETLCEGRVTEDPERTLR